jgi:hypothetical protein
MSDGTGKPKGEGSEPQRTENEQRALEALRQLPLVGAPEEVRSRARAAFVRGQAAVRDVREPRTAGAAAPLRGRRVAAVWPLSLAASILLVTLSYGLRSDMTWRMVAVADPDGVLQGDPTRVAGARLEPGYLETPEHGEYELALSAELRLRLTPGSGLSLPKPPRRWMPGEMKIEVRRGEVYGSSAGSELPTPLLLVTRQATARVRGTTFAVFALEESTCVCLLEGAIEVRAAAAPEEPIEVPPGHKCFVYGDGRPHAIVAIDDMERMKLDMIRNAAARSRPRRRVRLGSIVLRPTDRGQRDRDASGHVVHVECTRRRCSSRRFTSPRRSVRVG